MKGWLVLLTLLIGVALGASGAVLGPRLAGPYLPEAIQGRAPIVEGEVVRKRRAEDRLLLTVATAQGGILATFSKKVAEIDLLVEEGDTLALALRRYEPLLDDPVIARVRKRTGTTAPR
jgi:hypothetical protein